VPDLATGAIGFPGSTPAASVPDEPVAGESPVLGCKESHQVLFDFFRGRGRREAQSRGETLNVRVDDDAHVDVEGVAEDDIRGFPPHPIEGEQCLHRVGDLPVMGVDQRPAAGLDIAGLVAVQANPADVLGELAGRSIGIIVGGPVFPEKIGSDDVDLTIRALGAENGGDEEFERVGEVQFTVGIGIGFTEETGDFPGAFKPALCGFTRHVGRGLSGQHMGTKTPRAARTSAVRGGEGRGGSGEVVNDGLHAELLEYLFHEFDVAWVDLIGVLGGLVREDQVQGDLIGLIDDRAGGANHFAGVIMEKAGDVAKVFVTACQQGLGRGGIRRVGPEDDNVGEHGVRDHFIRSKFFLRICQGWSPADLDWMSEMIWASLAFLVGRWVL